MKRIKIILFYALWIISNEVVCQTHSAFENLSVDRPDVSNLPTTVRPGHFQFEIGTEYYKSDYANEIYTPNFMFRTGLNKKTELRIGFNNLRQDSLVNNKLDKILFTNLSIKYRFLEEKGLRPAIAIQPEFGITFGEGRERTRSEADFRQSDYGLFLLFNNTLHEKIFINYNAGIYWNKDERLDYLLSASTSFLHTHRLGYFLEVYTLIQDENELPISFDGGLTFLVTPRFQVDAYFGNREEGEDRYWFGGVGVGFRIDPEDLQPKTFKDIGIHH